MRRQGLPSLLLGVIGVGFCACTAQARDHAYDPTSVDRPAASAVNSPAAFPAGMATDATTGSNSVAMKTDRPPAGSVRSATADASRPSNEKSVSGVSAGKLPVGINGKVASSDRTNRAQAMTVRTVGETAPVRAGNQAATSRSFLGAVADKVGGFFAGVSSGRSPAASDSNAANVMGKTSASGIQDLSPAGNMASQPDASQAMSRTDGVRASSALVPEDAARHAGGNSKGLSAVQSSAGRSTVDQAADKPSSEKAGSNRSALSDKEQGKPAAKSSSVVMKSAAATVSGQLAPMLGKKAITGRDAEVVNFSRQQAVKPETGSPENKSQADLMADGHLGAIKTTESAATVNMAKIHSASEDREGQRIVNDDPDPSANTDDAPGAAWKSGIQSTADDNHITLSPQFFSSGMARNFPALTLANVKISLLNANIALDEKRPLAVRKAASEQAVQAAQTVARNAKSTAYYPAAMGVLTRAEIAQYQLAPSADLLGRIGDHAVVSAEPGLMLTAGQCQAASGNKAAAALLAHQALLARNRILDSNLRAEVTLQVTQLCRDAGETGAVYQAALREVEGYIGAGTATMTKLGLEALYQTQVAGGPGKLPELSGQLASQVEALPADKKLAKEKTVWVSKSLGKVTKLPNGKYLLRIPVGGKSVILLVGVKSGGNLKTSDQTIKAAVTGGANAQPKGLAAKRLSAESVTVQNPKTHAVLARYTLVTNQLFVVKNNVLQPAAGSKKLDSLNTGIFEGSLKAAGSRILSGLRIVSGQSAKMLAGTLQKFAAGKRITTAQAGQGQNIGVISNNTLQSKRATEAAAREIRMMEPGAQAQGVASEKTVSQQMSGAAPGKPKKKIE